MGSTPASPRNSAFLDCALHPDSPSDRRRRISMDASRTTGSPADDDDDDDDDESSTFSEEASPGGIGARLVSCLAIMRHDLSVTGDEPAVKSPRGAAVRGPRPPAGCTLRVRWGLGFVGVGGGMRECGWWLAAAGLADSAVAVAAAAVLTPKIQPAQPLFHLVQHRMQRRLPTDDPDAASRCWDECDATTYSIRSLDYMRTKVWERMCWCCEGLVAGIRCSGGSIVGS